MADMLENPPARKEYADTEIVPDSALPQVTDGAVYLPAGRPIEPESPEFEALLRKSLPSEILPDVLSNWRGVSARTSRLQLFAAILFLLASAAFLYWFFPPVVHQDLAPYGGLEIRNTCPASPFSSSYRSLNREAAAAYDRGDYHKVCSILRSSVEKIVRNGDRESYILAFRYFQAVRKLHGDKGVPAAAGLLDELMRKDPDTPAWAQFRFELTPRIRAVLDYEQVAQRLRQNPEYRSGVKLRLHDVKIAMDALGQLRRITNKKKFSEAEWEKHHEAYDLYEVKLLLSKWLLKGFPKGLPDNENDPGVAEREDALKIAGKHEDSRCEDFWRARLFIVETLISKDSWRNWIYWNHQVHKTLDALKAEKQKCLERLKER